MSEVAVIGDEVSVLPFRGLGVDVFHAEASAEAGKLLAELAARTPPYAVILITEQLAGDLLETISEVVREQQVAVSFIPGVGGTLGLGRERMRGLVRRAIGAEL